VPAGPSASPRKRGEQIIIVGVLSLISTPGQVAVEDDCCIGCVACVGCGDIGVTVGEGSSRAAAYDLCDVPDTRSSSAVMRPLVTITAMQRTRDGNDILRLIQASFLIV
jgi:hypothetical protein